ncbi:MAG: pantoate--beta-alanine ligase, partial [Candidatus Acidiferrales bacterium]
RSLLEVERQFDAGERDSATLIAAATKIFAAESEVRLDYFEIVDPATLIPLPEITNQALVAVAAHVGATRLIDNITLSAQP